MNDERQAFEAWALSVGWHDRDLIRAHSGDYREWPTQKAWQGWRGAHERLTPCGCSIGTCESKPNRLCRMTVEIAERAELQAARAASPVPAGWKLVPVEPTEAMLLAGYDWTNELDCQGEFAGTKKIYAAMLAASPPAPPTPQQPPMLDDDGRAMIVNSHHYTAANIQAIIDRLRAFSDPEQTALADWDKIDWRGECNVWWRVMSGLFHGLEPAQPPTPQPPQGAQQEWQPIATAPKDGTEILGYTNEPWGGFPVMDVRVCSWEPLDNPVARQWGISGTWHRRHVASGKSLMGGAFQPTHWMPLPAPPSQEGETR
jgi:hypothetical protein